MQDGGFRPQDSFDLRDLGVLEGPPDHDFDLAVAIAARAVRVPIATLAIIDFEAGITRLRAETGFVDLGRHVYPIDPDATTLLASLSPHDVVMVNDIGMAPFASRHPMIREHGIQSFVLAPVYCPAAEVVALLGVHDRVPRIWTRDDRHTLNGLAHFCTQSILQRATLRTLGLLFRHTARG